MSQIEQENGSWHLSKSVPVALIVAIIIQSASGVWWAATVTSNQDSFRQNQIVLQEELQKNRLETQEENLRQWAKISQNEKSAGTALSQSNVTQALLSRIDRDLQEMKKDIKAILGKYNESR